MHRGAAGSDESTGDGAGILFQIPHEFFDEEVRRLRFRLPERNRYGVAMVFRPAGSGLSRTLRGPSEPGHRSPRPQGAGLARRADRQLLSGRAGPGGRAGPSGRSSSTGLDWKAIALERQLYLARKRAERLVAEHFGEQAEDFYLRSMSCRTIVYKGMFLAPQLFAYYPDLSDEPDRLGAGDRSPALQHQHLPQLAAGPAVPHDRPQRRDQHAERQREPDAGPRGVRWPARCSARI